MSNLTVHGGRNCPRCLQTNPEIASFCMACGAALPPLPPPLPTRPDPPILHQVETIRLPQKAPQAKNPWGIWLEIYQFIKPKPFAYWSASIIFSLVYQAIVGIPILGLIAILFLGGPLYFGWYQLVLRAYDQDDLDIGILFNSFSNLQNYMEIYLKSLVPQILGILISMFLGFPVMIISAGILSGIQQGSGLSIPSWLVMVFSITLAIMPAILGIIKGMGLKMAFGFLHDNPTMSSAVAFEKADQLSKLHFKHLFWFVHILGLIAFLTPIPIWGWFWLFPAYKFAMPIYYRGLLSQSDSIK